MKIEQCYFTQPMDKLGKYLGIVAYFEPEELSVENFGKLLDDQWEVLRETIIDSKADWKR